MIKVGIVGAGELGGALAKALEKAGCHVQVANSRGPGTLAKFEQETGARAVEIADVATDVEFLILAIPLGQVPALPAVLLSAKSTQTVVIDASNYVPPRDGHIPEIDAGMPESSWVASQFVGPVTKAFNNITYTSLQMNGAQKGDPRRIALPVCGDDMDARQKTRRLVNLIGFDALDGGPLAESWRQQIGQPPYCTDGNLAELKALLARAEQTMVAPNREKAMEMMVKIPTDFSKIDLTRAARFIAGLDRLHPKSWLSLGRLVIVMALKK